MRCKYYLPWVETSRGEIDDACVNNEALEQAKNELATCGSVDCDAARLIFRLFPQLRESEDERIRKEIISALKFANDGGVYDKHIAYLEKQKEQEFDEDGDFTIYHPQKNGEGNYECIPFSFYGSLTSFSEDKDLMDFLNESFYDKEECERWCEVENKPELPECKHKIKKDSVFDYLCDSSGGEKQKEQKPSDLSEMMVHKEPYIAPVSTPMVADEQKPAEWSEEDEDRIRQIERIAQQAGCTQKLQEEIHDWLKSLRPSWKPSEEQNEPEYYQHFDPDLLAMTNAELIAKIKAEIERRIKECEATYPKDKGGYWFPDQEEAYAIAEEYKQLLSFLDTLESEKPMNLEEELEEEIEKKYDQEKWGYVDGFGSLVMDKDQFIRIARHFAQWGSEHLKK